MSDSQSAAAAVAVLQSILAPRSVVDMGSFDQRWAAAFHQAGVDVLAVRPPGRPGTDGVPTLVHDPRHPLVLDRRYDLALSIGGARELPATDALSLVASLCAAADVIAFAREAPGLLPPGQVSASRPFPWHRLFAHHSYVALDPADVPLAETIGGGGTLPPGVVVYGLPERLPATAGGAERPVPDGPSLPDATAWRLVRKQLLASEARADKRHREAVLLWAALVATQRQLLAASYRLLRAPDGGPLDSKTLLVRAVTGALPLRRTLKGALGPTVPFWDRRWYLTRYPDVATARLSPLWHYRRHGAPTRRSPHPWVDPAWYAARNPEVVATGEDPVEHYFRKGWKEGRDPHPLFDTRWYTSQREPGETWPRSALEHYLRRGRGRSPHPLLDANFYRRSNPDLMTGEVDPVQHFLTRGWFEGRDPHPLFDVEWYLERYVDVAREGLNPLVHYLGVGWEQGCDPHPMFDTSWYLKTYPEVKVAGMEPLTHYLTVGAAEGRSPGPLFDTAWYVSRHPDAAAGGRNPLTYFLTEGAVQGHAPAPWAEEGLRTAVAPVLALLEGLGS